jgi:transcriptional regulator with AAA-type ATPase domain/nucleoside phosphorylase
MAPADEDTEPRSRALILTALREEYRAARSHLTEIREITHPQGSVYEIGEFRDGQDRVWDVAIAEVGAGNIRTAAEAERAIAFLKPALVMFIGVAGGIKDVAVGDVVAATKVYGYESGKAGTTFQPRPAVRSSTYRMEQRAKAEAKKTDWLGRITPRPKQDPRAFVGPIAAGEKVIASRRSSVYKFLKSSYGDALAVEMEGIGFMDAAWTNHNVEAMVIRGISDLISGKGKADTKGSQSLAARHASAFGYQLLCNVELTARWTLILSGTVSDVDKPVVEAIVNHLRTLSMDSRLTFKRIETGSVVLTLEGSLEGFQRVRSMFRRGALREVSDREILSVELALTEDDDAPIRVAAPEELVQDLLPIVAGDISLPGSAASGVWGKPTPTHPTTYIDEEPDLPGIIGESTAIKRCVALALRVATHRITVLISGETGTGKELLAAGIHKLSLRPGPLVVVDCGGMPAAALERELFGSEAGVFAGATAPQIGRFERAHQGTLLLDEIGEMPLELQPRLLRALQDQEFEGVGGKTIRTDVRVIATTNRDLAREVSERRFRADLYYRLNVLPIHVPPLRERREDVRPLAQHFVRKFAERFRKRIEAIPAEAMEYLVAWDWPGNVRELEHLIERSVILSDGPILNLPVEEIPMPELIRPREATLAEVERAHILRVLRETHGTISGRWGAAARLGLTRKTLQTKIQRLGITDTN